MSGSKGPDGKAGGGKGPSRPRPAANRSPIRPIASSSSLYERYKDALRRGHVAALRGRNDVAIEAYGEAASIAPDRALPHASIGGILVKLNRPADAVASYERALALAPRDETALRGLAETLTRLGRRPAAADALDRLATTLDAGGRTADATDSARRALELAETPERRARVEELAERLRTISPGDEAADRALSQALKVLEAPEPGEPLEAPEPAEPPAAGEPETPDEEVVSDEVPIEEIVAQIEAVESAAAEPEIAEAAPAEPEIVGPEAAEPETVPAEAWLEAVVTEVEQIPTEALVATVIAESEPEPAGEVEPVAEAEAVETIAEEPPDDSIAAEAPEPEAPKLEAPEPEAPEPELPEVEEEISEPVGLGIALGAAAEAQLYAGQLAEAQAGLLSAARAHRRAGRLVAALDACYLAIGLAPADPELHLLLAEIYLDRGWRSQAADKLVLLSRLADLDGDPATHERLCAVVTARLPDEPRVAELCA